MLAVLTAGCIATNPRWDRPDEAGDDAASSADDDAGETTGHGITGGDEASSSGLESSWTGSGDESSSGSMPSGDDGPACEDGKTSCGGECKDTSKDRRACGPACLDCTQELDSEDAVCEQGECRSDNSGPGGDGDDDD